MIRFALKNMAIKKVQIILVVISIIAKGWGEVNRVYVLCYICRATKPKKLNKKRGRLPKEMASFAYKGYYMN